MSGRYMKGSIFKSLQVAVKLVRIAAVRSRDYYQNGRKFTQRRNRANWPFVDGHDQKQYLMPMVNAVLLTKVP